MIYSVDATGKMDFTPEQIKEGKLRRFVDVLFSMKCEIKVSWIDGGFAVVEYIDEYKRLEGYEYLLTNDVEE